MFTHKGPMPQNSIKKIPLLQMLTFVLFVLSFSLPDFLSRFPSSPIHWYTFPKKQENPLT